LDSPLARRWSKHIRNDHSAKAPAENKGATFTLVFSDVRKGRGSNRSSRFTCFGGNVNRCGFCSSKITKTQTAHFTNLLRRRGYHVQSALSFNLPLDLSANEEFDVLISDLALPDGSGIDLMQNSPPSQL